MSEIQGFIIIGLMVLALVKTQLNYYWGLIQKHLIHGKRPWPWQKRKWR
jgi:hypothetical protein